MINAVVLAVCLMLVLSLVRVPVVAAIMLSAIIGGITGGLDFSATMQAFNDGLTQGAGVAINYALLGAFAFAIARSGIADVMIKSAQTKLGSNGKWFIIGACVIAAVMSQNLIPIHIAFIPLLIPPILKLCNALQLDRRVISCAIAFGLVTTYMWIPYGYGLIYLDTILLGNLKTSGLNTDGLSGFQAMVIPACGMLLGLLVAVFYSYRKPRVYQDIDFSEDQSSHAAPTKLSLMLTGLAVVVGFTVQVYTNSMALGALCGFAVLTFAGFFKWHETDHIFTEGMRMMAVIGFIMITASGFAEVLRATGDIDTLVSSIDALLGSNKALSVAFMLIVGLLITMGIGSSFSTIPIIAAIFAPLGMSLGLSPLAIVALVGTAGALGDAGSPASDTTLGPTAGLNVDGQHDHIRDTVIPTFLHYNIPLLVFGWIAAMTL